MVTGIASTILLTTTIRFCIHVASVIGLSIIGQCMLAHRADVLAYMPCGQRLPPDIEMHVPTPHVQTIAALSNNVSKTGC